MRGTPDRAATTVSDMDHHIQRMKELRGVCRELDAVNSDMMGAGGLDVFGKYSINVAGVSLRVEQDDYVAFLKRAHQQAAEQAAHSFRALRLPS